MGQTVHHCKLSKKQKAYRKTFIIQVKKHKEKGQLRTMRVQRERVLSIGAIKDSWVYISKAEHNVKRRDTSNSKELTG